MHELLLCLLSATFINIYCEVEINFYGSFSDVYAVRPAQIFISFLYTQTSIK